MRGEIKFWDDKRGFGFIKIPAEQRDVSFTSPPWRTGRRSWATWWSLKSETTSEPASKRRTASVW